jgi:type IV pilus biogenesis protein CpaD/CtpE
MRPTVGQQLTAAKRDALRAAADRYRQAQADTLKARYDLERALVVARAEGRSVRQLEQLSGLSRMTVQRILKDHARLQPPAGSPSIERLLAALDAAHKSAARLGGEFS